MLIHHGQIAGPPAQPKERARGAICDQPEMRIPRHKAGHQLRGELQSLVLYDHVWVPFWLWSMIPREQRYARWFLAAVLWGSASKIECTLGQVNPGTHMVQGCNVILTQRENITLRHFARHCHLTAPQAVIRTAAYHGLGLPGAMRGIINDPRVWHSDWNHGDIITNEYLENLMILTGTLSHKLLRARGFDMITENNLDPAILLGQEHEPSAAQRVLIQRTRDTLKHNIAFALAARQEHHRKIAKSNRLKWEAVNAETRKRRHEAVSIPAVEESRPSMRPKALWGS